MDAPTTGSVYEMRSVLALLDLQHCWELHGQGKVRTEVRGSLRVVLKPSIKGSWVGSVTPRMSAWPFRRWFSCSSMRGESGCLLGCESFLAGGHTSRLLCFLRALLDSNNMSLEK